METILDGSTWSGVQNIIALLTLPELAYLTLDNATVNQNALFVQNAGSKIKFYGSTFNVFDEYQMWGGRLETYSPAPSELHISGGTFRKLGENSEGVIDLFVRADNDSTLAVEAGQLTLTEGGSFDNSLITLTEGDNGREPALRLDATQDGGPEPLFTFENAQIEGEGEFWVNAAIATDSTLEFGDSTYLDTLAQLKGNGTFINHEESEIIVANAASVTRKLSADLHNLGAITHNGPGWLLDGGKIHNEGEHSLQGDNYYWGATLVEHPDHDNVTLQIEEHDTLFLSDVTSHISTTPNGGFFHNDGGRFSLERGPSESDTFAAVDAFFQDAQGIIHVGESSQLLFSGGGDFQGTTFTIQSSPDIDYWYHERPTLTFRGITENYQLKNVTFASEGTGGVVQFDGKITADGRVALGQETTWGSLVGQSLLAGADENSQFVNPEMGRFQVTTGLKLPIEVSNNIALIDDYRHELSTTLRNEGLMELTPGYVEVDIKPTGRIDNRGTFVLHARDGADFTLFFDGYPQPLPYESDSDGWHRIKGDGDFINRSGEVIKKGDKASFIEVNFQNLAGQVTVEEGLLALEAGGVSDNGAFTIEEAGILRLADGTYHFTGTENELENQGLLEFDGASLVIDEWLELNGTVNMFDRDSAHNSLAGEGTLRNVGELTIGSVGSGRFDVEIDTFENASILNLAGGFLDIRSQVVNKATFNLQGSGDILGSTTAKFVNQGKFRARSEGTRKVKSFFGSSAGSLVDAAQGTLRFEGGSSLQGNFIKIAEGATLQLQVNRSNQTNTVNGALLTQNLGTLEIGGGSARGPMLTVESDFELQGNVVWKSGQIVGQTDLINQGNLLIEDAERLGTDLVNHCHVDQRSDIALEEGAHLENTGTWQLSKGTNFGLTDTIRPYLRYQSDNSFQNSGELHMTASNIVSIGVDVENTGLVQVGQGELRLKDAFTQSGEGQLVLAGGVVHTTERIDLLSGELIADGGSLKGALSLADVHVLLGDRAGEIQTLTLSQGQYTDTDATRLTFDITENNHDQITLASGSGMFDGIVEINLSEAAAQSLAAGDRIQIIAGNADVSSDGIELVNEAISDTLSFVVEDNAAGIALVVQDDSGSQTGSQTGNQTGSNTANGVLPSEDNFNIIQGSEQTDFLTGTTQNDWYKGGAGNDTLWDYYSGDDVFAGGAGNDTVYAGIGDDILNGGAGDDTYQGGAGADYFMIENNFGTDTVLDFQLSQDKLVLGSGLSIDALSFAQSGEDTLVQLSGSGQVIARLNNLEVTQLSSAHFFTA